MRRLAAATTRLLQSLRRPWETMLQCHMDELLVMIQGEKVQRDNVLAMILLTMRALRSGNRIAKGQQGRESDVGQYHVGGEPRGGIGRAGSIAADDHRPAANLDAWSTQDALSLNELQAATGVLGWLSGLVPHIRWAASVFRAVVGDAKQDEWPQLDEVKPDKKRARGEEVRPQMVARVRLGAALPWMTRLSPADCNRKAGASCRAPTLE